MEVNTQTHFSFHRPQNHLASSSSSPPTQYGVVWKPVSAPCGKITIVILEFNGKKQQSDDADRAHNKQK